jgi:DNA-binding NarL/FixJ family response regulator
MMLPRRAGHIRGTTGPGATTLCCVGGGIGVRRAAVVVGREVELDLLLRAVQRARTGEPSCVLLLGEGGVGKTRLLTETGAASRRLGLAVLAGRAPITAPVAFSVVAEALRSWLRGHPTEENERAAPTPFDQGLRLVLPEWPDPEDRADLTEAQVRLLALEGVVQLVREIAAANGAAVVLLDDLHAADPDSLEVARYLSAAAIEGTVVVGALRAGESPLADELTRTLGRDGVAEVVELAPLATRAVTDLVAALLDAAPPEALVDDIVARTDGVPLLVEEVLDAHLRAGSVEVGAGGTVWRGGAVAVPRTVRDMVEDRLSHLTSAHRGLLVAGALLGDFEPELIAAVADVDVVSTGDALAAGIGAGLLEMTGGTLGFRHAVIREAVLATALPHVIEVMHRRAAAALGSAPQPDGQRHERRAQHLLAVGDHDGASRLLTTAADARLGEHALLGSERLARSALDHARAAATRAAAADALARSLAAQGRWSEALEVDASTVAERGEEPARSQRMAMSALEAGRPDVAEPIIARAIAAGDESPFIHIAAGRAALVAGDAERAVASARAVLEGTTSAGDENVDARLSALELQGRAFDFLGQRSAAEAAWTQQAHEALAAGRTQAQLRAVVLLGKVELFAGRPPVRLYEAVDLARRAGALVELAWAEENLGVALGIHGDIAGSVSLLAAAVARCRALRLDQLAYLLAQQAMVQSFTGEPVEDLLAEAEALTPTDDLRLHIASYRGDIALRQGRYEDAVHWLELCSEIMRTLPGIVPSDSSCWLVWALAAAGRTDDAARALDAARAMPDLARWYGRPVLVAAAEALLAGSEAGIDAAIATATGPMRFDIAQMRVLGAEILRGPSRLRWLQEALATYDAVGAPLAADRVRRLIREAGGPVPRRRRAAAPVPDDLAQQGVTARELEVLQLLGDGLSNADIAERLYVSVRTVESHVSSLLAKLHARSRGQLTAALLRTRGPTDVAEEG